MAVSSRAIIRVLLFLAIATAFALAWRQLDQISLLVIGQPVSTGMLQADMEAPFFANLQRSTGLPLKVVYKPLSATGIKDAFQLQLLREGSIDLASLRFIQNSHLEPGLSGIDFFGVSRDFADARSMTAAYAPTLNRYLEKSSKVHLLAVWTFGPQVLFCNRSIRRMGDVRGLKVRVASDWIGDIFSELGATPAVLPFDQTEAALAIGLVDCAVTSAASANHAGWLKHAKVQFQMPVHFGINGFVISLRKWRSFTPRQQQVLADAFKAFEERLWSYSQTLEVEVTRCNTGGPCTKAIPHQLQLITPTADEIALLRRIALRKVLPAWGADCDRVHPGCLREWRQIFLSPQQSIGLPGLKH